MRWWTFIVLAAAVLVCQTAVAPLIAIESVRPNWMFVLAVHYALWGRWPEAAIAAWFLGLAVDLTSLPASGRIGLSALLFGAAAWGMLRMRPALRREHAAVHLILTFVFSLAVELLTAIYDHWGVLRETPGSRLFWPAFFTGLYTAAFAPYMHWVLIRCWRWTGLRPPVRLPSPRQR